jgi:hypothetical protein
MAVKLEDPRHRLQALLGTSNALRIALALHQGDFGRLASNVEKVGHAAGTTDRAFSIWLKTGQAHVDEFKASLEDLGIAMGQDFLPFLNDAEKVVVPLMNDFGTFSRQNPEVVQSFIALGLAIGGISLAMKAVMALAAPFRAAILLSDAIGGGTASGGLARIIGSLAGKPIAAAAPAAEIPVVARVTSILGPDGLPIASL